MQELARFSEQGNKFGFTSGNSEFTLLSSNLYLFNIIGFKLKILKILEKTYTKLWSQIKISTYFNQFIF
jgi:hypothetical protein